MKKMIYPAIFHQEDDSYWVEFPDLEGCQSYGLTLAEVHEGAKEALTGYLIVMLEQGKHISPPTDIRLLDVPKDAFVSLVDADLIKKSQLVEKTLNIPSWLNDHAENNHINFSSVLQEALMQKLELSS